VRASCAAQKYRRLAALKAECDPDNLFRNNPNIPPAATGLPSPRKPARQAMKRLSAESPSNANRGEPSTSMPARRHRNTGSSRKHGSYDLYLVPRTPM